MKTLIVEDEPLSRLLFQTQIELFGYEVTLCANAETALKIFKETFYPLIVSDLGLPGMDGLELCRRIRALPRGDQCMILVVTARDTPEDLQAVLDAGADDYLVKPIGQEVLNVRLTIMERRIYNLTQRQKAEQERENLIALIENSSDFIAMASLDGNLLYINKAGQNLVGLDNVRKPKTAKMLDYFPEGELARMKQAIATVLQGEVWKGESQFKHIRTDRLIPVEINFFLITHQNTHQPIALATVTRDITRRKQAEEERRQLDAHLRQSQRLESLGILAGGIAHDFNNILGTMLGYTEILLGNHAENSKEKNCLQEIYQAGERAAGLVQQILTFSRAQEQQLIPTDIVPVIEEALSMIRATTPANVEIRQHFQSDCRPILADATQIHQMIVNLGVNARHAMREKGGILELNLKEVTYDLHQGNRQNLAPGTYLKLTVSDTGCGMPADVQEHIFEPFFSTKDIGEGTGLGLSVVHGVIKSHQGLLTVESEPGQGATFRIILPIIESPVLYKEPGENFHISARKAHILIVEDESALAKMHELALTKLGYEVTIQTSSLEALELFRASPKQFDFVFTDQGMPVMTGSQLSQELLKMRPDIPIVLTTGYSDTMSEETAESLGIREFLFKPVKIGILAHVIQEILEDC